MDWMLIGTILGGVGAVIVPMAIYIVNRLRSSDWTVIKGMKADSDTKISNIDNKLIAIEGRVSNVYTDIQAKLDKAEHNLALARLDKEMDNLRRDNREDFTKIDTKLDRLTDLIIETRK